jgi:hypothetical protein
VTRKVSVFVVALVLIAAAVFPAHSAPLRYAVLLLDLAIPANAFVAFVAAPQTTLLLAMPPYLLPALSTAISTTNAIQGHTVIEIGQRHVASYIISHIERPQIIQKIEV